VDVAVADDAAERELVEAGEGDLAGVGVAGQDERDAGGPQAVGLLGDVRQAEGREVGAQAVGRALPVGVAGVGVVEADDLEALVAARGW
jgi:hypothetical protein